MDGLYLNEQLGQKKIKPKHKQPIKDLKEILGE